MSRRTRKQLVLEDEALARRDREEGYRRLEVELRRFWHQANLYGTYPQDASLAPSLAATKYSALPSL
jgi:hypothetical protein